MTVGAGGPGTPSPLAAPAGEGGVTVGPGGPGTPSPLATSTSTSDGTSVGTSGSSSESSPELVPDMVAYRLAKLSFLAQFPFLTALRICPPLGGS